MMNANCPKCGMLIPAEVRPNVYLLVLLQAMLRGLDEVAQGGGK